MLAFLGNFSFLEILVVGVGALLIFGKRLPEVAMKAAAQVVRFRRAVGQLWREAGIEDELRRVQREIERDVPIAKIKSPTWRRAGIEQESRQETPELERDAPIEKVKRPESER